jgi:DNA invertase Pin-like site-specific DNA recombinase
MATKQACAYFRVSTQKQSRSGLGLDAQRSRVSEFARSEGFNILTQFIEVCPPSALMRQVGWVEEGRISGSS